MKNIRKYVSYIHNTMFEHGKLLGIFSYIYDLSTYDYVFYNMIWQQYKIKAYGQKTSTSKCYL
jgi:hypothetical protein